MKLALSVEQVCRLVKGETTLDQSFLLERIGSLEFAGPNDLAVVFERGEKSAFDPVAISALHKSEAALIIAKSQLVPDRHFLLVDDPLAAYTQIVQFVQQHATSAEEVIHPTASICSSAHLGAGVHIGAHAVIQSGARIGAYARIGAHVVIQAGAIVGDGTVIHASSIIGRQCRIGSQSIIQSGVVIGGDGFGYQAEATGMRKIPHIGIVYIGNHVEIGSGCCIDRATFDATIIEDGVKIDNLVHIAHNVRIGAGTAVLAQTGIAGSVDIGRGCQIGGQVAIKDSVTIGDGARIVSKSAVMKSVAAKETVCGQPAQDFRAWKRLQVLLQRLLSDQKKRSHDGLWRTVSGVMKRLRGEQK